ncbi:DUF2256 domain-containing protein [Marinobacterium mangrovicola]|uniref:DUF2256 domain-containing protein n=1 Tax=Marinobacterium mangrovicola TaxID=1476959 RepID=UPI001052CF5E|nr:DUF2256 domain-containing protein [Marinobacterium mangrovicola]
MYAHPLKRSWPVHAKPHLPSKICPVCERPFSWRKKWAREWESVIYCSERCRRSKYRRVQDSPASQET